MGLTKRKYEGAGLLEERKEGNKDGGWQIFSVKSQTANIFYSTGHMIAYKFLVFSNEEGSATGSSGRSQRCC